MVLPSSRRRKLILASINIILIVLFWIYWRFVARPGPLGPPGYKPLLRPPVISLYYTWYTPELLAKESPPHPPRLYESCNPNEIRRQLNEIADTGTEVVIGEEPGCWDLVSAEMVPLSKKGIQLQYCPHLVPLELVSDRPEWKCLDPDGQTWAPLRLQPNYAHPEVRQALAEAAIRTLHRYVQDPHYWQFDDRPVVTFFWVHNQPSYDPHSRKQFQDWLALEYKGSISRLNRLWNSNYTAFSEIQPPPWFEKGPKSADWHRFHPIQNAQNLAAVAGLIRGRYPGVAICYLLKTVVPGRKEWVRGREVLAREFEGIDIGLLAREGAADLFCGWTEHPMNIGNPSTKPREEALEELRVINGHLEVVRRYGKHTLGHILTVSFERWGARYPHDPAFLREFGKICDGNDGLVIFAFNEWGEHATYEMDEERNRVLGDIVAMWRKGGNRVVSGEEPTADTVRR